MQDDEDDWKESASQMASIYENSLVTLAATCSPDSNGGLFSCERVAAASRLSRTPNVYVRAKKKISHLPDTYRGFSTSIDAKSMKEFPLLFRAWVCDPPGQDIAYLLIP
jgi:hypothetical protein